MAHSAERGAGPPGTGLKEKSRRRPTLARAGPALPSAMGGLTSVFGMGTGISPPLWPPAEAGESETRENRNATGKGWWPFPGEAEKAKPHV